MRLVANDNTSTERLPPSVGSPKETNAVLDQMTAWTEAATLLDRALREAARLVETAGALGEPAVADVARRVRAIDAAALLALPAEQAAGLLRRLTGSVEQLTAVLATGARQ